MKPRNWFSELLHCWIWLDKQVEADPSLLLPHQSSTIRCHTQPNNHRLPGWVWPSTWALSWRKYQTRSSRRNRGMLAFSPILTTKTVSLPLNSISILSWPKLTKAFWRSSGLARNTRELSQWSFYYPILDFSKTSIIMITLCHLASQARTQLKCRAYSRQLCLLDLDINMNAMLNSHRVLRDSRLRHRPGFEYNDNMQNIHCF